MRKAHRTSGAARCSGPRIADRLEHDARGRIDSLGEVLAVHIPLGVCRQAYSAAIVHERSATLPASAGEFAGVGSVHRHSFAKSALRSSVVASADSDTDARFLPLRSWMCSCSLLMAGREAKRGQELRHGSRQADSADTGSGGVSWYRHTTDIAYSLSHCSHRRTAGAVSVREWQVEQRQVRRSRNLLPPRPAAAATAVPQHCATPHTRTRSDHAHTHTHSHVTDNKGRGACGCICACMRATVLVDAQLPLALERACSPLSCTCLRACSASQPWRASRRIWRCRR